VNAIVRLSMPLLGFSLETSLVRGLVGARRFTTQRMGLGIRVH